MSDGPGDEMLDNPEYCPHGVEVGTSDGACYWCALEDLDDD
jgi:hypothetical protein